jgi:hypothetical protein
MTVQDPAGVTAATDANEDRLMLTDRFAAVLAYAERLHRSQTRKGNTIPYITHLMAVCATVLEWGGDEDAAIAGLLHDAVEDQGGLERLADIRARFGDRVADAVAACSDSTTADKEKKAPWRQRKTTHLDHLKQADAMVALVTAADKLHNLNAIIRDVRYYGPATLGRFHAGPEEQVWYFRSVAAALAGYRDIAPVAEIEQGVAVLAGLLGLPATTASASERELAMDAGDIIRLLDLKAHPEGGHYVEIWREAGPDGARGATTAIYFLLSAGEVSHWHRVDATEIWNWYAGSPLLLSISGDDRRLAEMHLGPDLLAGQRPQAVVPAHHWQSARSLGAWTLVGCTVSPAFDFAGFELAPPGWQPGTA